MGRGGLIGVARPHAPDLTADKNFALNYRQQLYKRPHKACKSPPASPSITMPGTILRDESAPESLYNPKFFEVEDDRDSRLRSCGMVDTPPEPRFDYITR